MITTSVSVGRLLRRAIAIFMSAMILCTNAMAAQATKDDPLYPYVQGIHEKLKSHMKIPERTEPRLQGVYRLLLFRDGQVSNATIVTSSGDSAFDDAVLRAIAAASPFKVPSDPALFARIRTLDLKVSP